MPNSRLLTERQIMAALNGSPAYLGVIQSTGTAKAQDTTTTTFTLDKGGLYLVQADADCRVKTGAGGGAAIAADTNSLKVLQDEKFYIMLAATEDTISMISVTGTVNLRVYKLN